jgi:DNA-binding NarL/FixJ family response regulator
MLRDDGFMSASVLLVDDDPDFRRLARRMLIAAGFVVLAEAATVAAALAMALDVLPDCALVDVSLPDGNGISLAGALAALPRPPRVLLMSSNADAANAEAVAGCGAVGFVPKGELPSVALRLLLAGH